MPKHVARFSPGRRRSAESVRIWRFQIGFLLLFAITAVQVVWWMVDQERIADRIAADRATEFELDRDAAESALRAGQSLQELDGLYPHLEIDESIRSLDDIEPLLDLDTGEIMDKFRLHGYHPHPAISFKVAV